MSKDYMFDYSVKHIFKNQIDSLLSDNIETYKIALDTVISCLKNLSEWNSADLDSSKKKIISLVVDGMMPKFVNAIHYDERRVLLKRAVDVTQSIIDGVYPDSGSIKELFLQEAIQENRLVYDIIDDKTDSLKLAYESTRKREKETNKAHFLKRLKDENLEQTFDTSDKRNIYFMTPIAMTYLDKISFNEDKDQKMRFIKELDSLIDDVDEIFPLSNGKTKKQRIHDIIMVVMLKDIPNMKKYEDQLQIVNKFYKE